MLSARETAKELKISERFLRQLVAERRIPFYRLSARTLRFDLPELRDFMRPIAQVQPSVTDEQGDDGTQGGRE